MDYLAVPSLQTMRGIKRLDDGQSDIIGAGETPQRKVGVVYASGQSAAET